MKQDIIESIKKNSITLDVINYINDLINNNQYLEVQALTNYINPEYVLVDGMSRYKCSIFYNAYIANYNLKDYKKCQYWLKQFEFAEFNDNIVLESNNLIYNLNKKIIASFDPAREAKDDEIVIVYGNFPFWYHYLPHSSKLYRHPYLFNSLKHTNIETHKCWDKLDLIYILNIDLRKDRYYEILVELCRIGAPLHKIHHYVVKEGEKSHEECTKNHVGIMKHFKDSNLNTCLVLEDDITFINKIEYVQDCISYFLNKDIEYTLCFLALSRWGEQLKPYDDVLGITTQWVTATGGFFLNKKTIDIVYSRSHEGYELLKNSGNGFHVIDQYWRSLPNRLYFRNKLSFQRPSYSNIQKLYYTNLY